MKQKKDNKYGTVEATRRTGISFERLRYWELRGIVKPTYIKCGVRKFRRYSQEDIYRAVVVKKLVDEKRYTLEGAIRKLEEQPFHPGHSTS